MPPITATGLPVEGSLHHTVFPGIISIISSITRSMPILNEVT
ncbi:MAG: hypothetical protein SV375_00170 [Thermodesulfobacteriota bacterium]|nr:hypothetical protein [Thermodesulfobacteriota bacterium]